MIKADVYNMEAKKTGTINLPKLFEVKVSPETMAKAIRYETSQTSYPTAHTKDRSERRGGGRKPWRQKGTGRARVGSNRSPLWRKGGIIFGPGPERNFATRLPRKERKKALFGAFSQKAAAKQLFVIKKIEAKEIKTKIFENLFVSLPNQGTFLVLIFEKNEKIDKSIRNIPYAKLILPVGANVTDVLKYDNLVIDEKSLADLEKQYEAMKLSGRILHGKEIA